MNNILYLSLVDWFWIKQRPQHFAQILSKNNLVTYMSQRCWREGTNTSCKHEIDDTNLNKSHFYLNKNLKIIRKRVIPKENKFRVIKILNESIIKTTLLKLDTHNNYKVIIITHPSQYPKIPKKFFDDKKVVYDCMDNYLEFNGVNKMEMIHNEDKILELCDYIIVSSINLYNNLVKRKNSIKNKITVINNGVDAKKFNIVNITSKNDVGILRKNDNIKVGYIGTISNWVDFNLIKKTAQNNKNIEFYFVGPIEKGVDVSAISNISNIIFTGTQPYDSIPNILSELDVAIMPFLKSDLVYSVNPVKIYEYLALGKPVVALKYGETEVFGDLIYTYESDIEFQEKIRAAIKEDKSKSVSRVEFANKNTWSNRVECLLEILDKD